MPGTALLLRDIADFGAAPFAVEQPPARSPSRLEPAGPPEPPPPRCATAPRANREGDASLGQLDDPEAVYHQELRRLTLLCHADEQQLGRELETARQLARLQQPSQQPARR